MTASPFALSLEAAGLDYDDRHKIYVAALPCAVLGGEVFGFGTVSDGRRWLERDHPNRVNLILEQLGRPERIAP